jgi:hypothetical protein
MPIITISRGSYSRGKEVAEKLCVKLGFPCVSREIILKASEHFNTPEIKLIRAIHDAPLSAKRCCITSKRTTWSIMGWLAISSCKESPTPSRSES